jgi:hypothetical protein
MVSVSDSNFGQILKGVRVWVFAGNFLVELVCDMVKLN